DVNRGIDVTYNHLNRPTKVSFGPNDYIQYTFDATGAKLSEIVYKGGKLFAQRHYIGGVHYEGAGNDNQSGANNPAPPASLAFIKIKEGRVLKSNGAWSYEYSLADHQGNVMATFGSLRDVNVYKACMETYDANKQATEESTFKNIYTNGVNRRSGLFNNTKPSAENPNPTWSIETNGAYAGKEMGPAKKLPTTTAGDRVSTGDHINMSVYAKFITPTSGANTDVLVGSLVGLATTTFGISSGETAYSGFSNYYDGGVGTVVANSGAPKAYLNYILFNSTYTSYQFGFKPVPSSTFEKLELDLVVPGAFDGGSIYIFTTNESNYFTYFDDIKIVHEKANPVLQVTQVSDYYPFGVPFNTWSKGSVSANRYTYQGQENQDDLDYNEYAYKFRMHDPSMGRFMSVDPLAEKYMYNSPYAFSENRVIDGEDLEGKEWTATKDKLGMINGFKWDAENAFDHNGALKEGYYQAAIFFQDKNTWQENKSLLGDLRDDGGHNSFNLGAATATVYGPGGSDDVTNYKATTYASDQSKFGTIASGAYQAVHANHKGIPALRLTSLDNVKNTQIPTIGKNPAHTDRVPGYADGVDIHFAGRPTKGQYFTGTFLSNNRISGVSEACLLIDNDKWSDFISNFDGVEKIGIGLRRNGDIPEDWYLPLNNYMPAEMDNTYFVPPPYIPKYK
ncbi:MAG TPA: RHS repeat-associated core domain-containing protein, partial [Cyclobacteriaceae bacterium]|nr:RHS repeat-associated core domain-containing protein [Cyclobacteriaceae bacterium]